MEGRVTLGVISPTVESNMSPFMAMFQAPAVTIAAEGDSQSIHQVGTAWKKPSFWIRAALVTAGIAVVRAL